MGNSRSSVLALIYGVFSNPGKLRILVVDDHAGMREGISAVINTQPDMMIVGEASDGHEAIQQFRASQPDVSLVDWNLPDFGGEQVLTTLRREFPNARFIIITSLSDGDCIRRALSLGAQAYLHKDMLRRELIPAIRAVHQGQRHIPEQLTNRPTNEG